MTDIVAPVVRSRMMAAVGGKNTKPELLVRTALHAAGLRYRIHDKTLPGKPDIVFPGRRAAVQVNGCFWHGHSCRRGTLPRSNVEFWTEKIGRNRTRDLEAVTRLHMLGWRCLIVWECLLMRNETARPVLREIENWVRTGSGSGEIGVDETGGAFVVPVDQ